MLKPKIDRLEIGVKAGIKRPRADTGVKTDQLTCSKRTFSTALNFSKICMTYISPLHFQNSNQCPLAFPLSPALPVHSAAPTYSKLTQFAGPSNASVLRCWWNKQALVVGFWAAKLHHG